MNRSTVYEVEGVRPRGWSKTTWEEAVVENDLKSLHVDKFDAVVDEIGERYHLNHAIIVQAVVCGTMYLQAACLQNILQLMS